MMEKLVLKNVTKNFNLLGKGQKSALNSFLSLFSRDFKNDFVVLNDISFSVNSKDIFGIIGNNGSGKSTLLRIIAGIYSLYSGTVSTHGKITYLSGFNNGLKETLTMRENIFLVGSILGLSQNNIKKIFDETVEFSGLRDFLDVKLSKFSDGMLSRLAFSITVHCISDLNPDILLLDEVFSGGADLEFKKKALLKMEKLIKKGITVVIVSHDMNLIKKYCNKVMVLEKGKIGYIGDPKSAINYYLRSVQNEKIF